MRRVVHGQGMAARVLDAYCEACAEVRKHDLLDPGSCKCQVCGRVQVLMTPIAPGQMGGRPTKPSAPV